MSTFSEAGARRIRGRSSYATIYRRSSSDISIGNSRFVDFTSFDFLSLCEDHRIRTLFIDSFSKAPHSLGSMRGLSGTSVELQYLEIQISKLLAVNNSIFCSSKNQAVFSCLSNLLTERDTIFIDVDATAPAADAAYLVGAQIHLIDCTNPNWVLTVIERSKALPAGAKAFCFFDELSPVTGVMQERLITLSKLKQHQIIPVVDITHSILLKKNLLDPPLFSVPSDKSLHPAHHFFIGAFGFSVPGFGAFIAGDSDVDLIKTMSNSLFIEPAPLPAACLAQSRILEFIPEYELKIPEIFERRIDFISKLSTSPFSLSVESSESSPIVVINCQTAQIALSLTEYLFERKILVARVPRGTLRSEPSLVRFVISSRHNDGDFEKLFSALSEFKVRI